MDKLKHYGQLLRDIMLSYAEIDRRQPAPQQETVALCDDEHGQYQLLSVGWSAQNARVLNLRIYARIHDNKIWIEEDWTEDGIATELLQAGVPREDIVLAFHEPAMRPYTEFAVA